MVQVLFVVFPLHLHTIAKISVFFTSLLHLVSSSLNWFPLSLTVCKLDIQFISDFLDIFTHLTHCLIWQFPVLGCGLGIDVSGLILPLILTWTLTQNITTKSNFHAMLHPSLGGSVLSLEYTWNTFQHWIAFYGMSQKPRKLAGGQHCHSQSQKPRTCSVTLILTCFPYLVDFHFLVFCYFDYRVHFLVCCHWFVFTVVLFFN
jgi:hypothetical protein